MTSQQETLVRRWVDEVLNRGELAVIDELYAPNFVKLSQRAWPSETVIIPGEEPTAGRAQDETT
jgi:hypothetical protein